MKTVKFGPYTQERQESYDITKFHFLDHDFGTGSRRVYSNINFSIFTDEYCNADCRFCVAQLRYENRKQQFCKKVADDETYFRKLEAAMQNIRPLNPTVSITGGEPTRSHRLWRILKLIDKYGFRKRTFTTNGSALLWAVPAAGGKTVLQLLIDHDFKHLNISKAHYDDGLNQQIMRYKNPAEAFTNTELKKVVKIAQENDLRPRMSCILLKKGVGSLEAMIRYMNFYQKIGVDNIIFRELMDFDHKKMINEEKMAFCDYNRVKLMDLWKRVDKDSRFTPVRSLRGYYYYVEVYKYQGIDMVTESANLVKLYDEKAKDPNNVYEVIFHPSSTLNGSWVESEDILIP